MFQKIVPSRPNLPISQLVARFSQRPKHCGVSVSTKQTPILHSLLLSGAFSAKFICTTILFSNICQQQVFLGDLPSSNPSLPLLQPPSRSPPTIPLSLRQPAIPLAASRKSPVCSTSPISRFYNKRALFDLVETNLQPLPRSKCWRSMLFAAKKTFQSTTLYRTCRIATKKGKAIVLSSIALSRKAETTLYIR